MSDRLSRHFKNTFDDEGTVNIAPELLKARVLSCTDQILKNFEVSEKNCNGGLYLGVAGAAYTLYYLTKCGWFPESSEKFMKAAHSYISIALQYCSRKDARPKRQVSFLLENGGVYAVAALIYNCMGDQQKSEQYIQAYRELAAICEPINFLDNGSDELFVGRAGYLLGVLLLQRDLKVEVLPNDQINLLCQRIIESGKKFRSGLHFDGNLPLMYAYYGTLCLGTGHGIAGILQVLLSFPEFLQNDPSAAESVQRSVDFLLADCLRDGNMATDLEEALTASGKGTCLVHWCHGAAGVIYTFARAYLVFGKKEKYLKACRELADTVWQKGLLKKGPGICHGVSGSGYVFLLMYRLTGEAKYLYRAERFASFMFTEVFNKEARTPDSPFSLFEGMAGTVCFLNDLLQPEKAEFPLCDVFLK